MASGQSKPAWLTDELADVDEWVDWQDEEDQSFDSAHSGSDLSLTQPLGSVLVRNNDLCGTEDASQSRDSAGTFIVREEMPQAPLLPKTPGRAKNPIVKDFFSPLALEKMFEPPSPPQPSSSLPPPSIRATTAAPVVPSRLSQVHLPPSEPSHVQEDEGEEAPNSRSISGRDHLRVDEVHGQFTFSIPHPSPFNPAGPPPNAQSTPAAGPPARLLSAPPTDPRLRLFQFQYDTFTRDHLSAMVDSIAVNTPSGEGATENPGSRQSTPSGLSPVQESSFTRLRSAKRIKLSPASDYSSEKGDGAAIILRPSSRKDYVAESRNMMDQIRKARDFSTVSTVATARSPAADRQVSAEVEEPVRKEVDQPPLRRPSFLTVPDDGSSRDPSPAGTVSSGRQSAYSSLGFRQQAANLMAQIRSDMKGSKRLFSGDTETSHMRNDDATESSTVSADTTVPSLRTRGGEFALQSRPRQPSTSQTQMRRVSTANARISSVSRGKQREKVTASPRNSTRHQRPSVTTADASKDLAEDFTRMSLESSHMLAQFPAPPVRLVSASTSTAPPSPAKQSPGLLAPPSGGAPVYPTSSLRTGRNADLTRFVSSSTASGTTVTVGSTESFVKHPGPKQFINIAPRDVPLLSDRVGKMVLDRTTMRWVKATALATASMPEVDEHVTEDFDDENDSEDPFRDIESLREDDSGTQGVPDGANQQDAQEDSMYLDEMNMERGRFEEADRGSEVEDAEEAELTSFSTDGPSQDYIPDMDEYSGFTDDTAPDEEGEETEGMMPTTTIDLPLEQQDDHGTAEPALDDTPPQYLAPAARPVQQASLTATPNPPSRSSIESASITPVSALKDPSRGRMYTPANKLGHRRSREGPIVGIGRNIPTPEVPLASGTVLVTSARSKRIANMLDDLGNDDYEDESPSKTSSSSRPPTSQLQPIPPRRPSTGPGAASSPLRSGSRRVSSRAPPTPRGVSGNATFLTECSFGVAHDRLVQVITDVQPFEPYWEELTSIDLSHRNLDSTARLKEFLPRLDSLLLNSNQLAWLSGVPGSVRTLSVASNLLTGVTSFSHLLNLENLDISRNQIDSLRQLECLRHLRELRADGNHIDSIDGLQKMDGLIKLSLQGNEIRELDLHDYKWSRLEMLNLSQNRIGSVCGLGSVPSLVSLNLDNNSLGDLEPELAMPRLRILRVSGNRLQTLNAAPFPNLRTLYADNNTLGTIVKAHRLTKLENLSLRNQSGRAGLTLSIRDVRDVKRLYLSGNPLKPGFLSEPCYNLVYLELAACRLITLPADFARRVPNVRVLNLNYNFLEDPSALEGLTRLRKLTIIGSRIKGAKQLVRVLRGMRDMEMIDFRQAPFTFSCASVPMNPCTLGWYLPLLVKDLPGALQPSDDDRHTGAPALPPPAPGAGQGPRRPAGPHHHHQAAAERGSAHGEPHAPSSGPSSHARASVPDGDGLACAPDAEPEAGRGRAHGGRERERERGGQELAWRELDAKFRRDLPDEAYVGRLAYRGLVMRACGRVRMLDGVEVERKERDKAERLLRSVFGGGSPGEAGAGAVGVEES
ncbi:hypothetical protein BC628DRAFT_1411747 [Trametes gibbosa]|nr:hypothetical protein BC628DRAFT_1411747 [Trametes gibbosa]